MQIFFRQSNCQISTWLATIASPIKAGRHRLDSLYISISVAAGLLWLALSGF